MKQNEMFGSAIWITDERAIQNTSVPFIIRDKFKTCKVKNAKIRILGLGIFYCYINGKRVGNDYFLPLNTEYERRDNFPSDEYVRGTRVYVPEYDITDLLEDGDNTIAIHYGGGWYTFFWGNMRFGDAKAIFRIYGEDANGEFEFCSGEGALSDESYVSGYTLTAVEHHDLTKANKDALEKDFDDGKWTPVIAAKPLDTEYLFSDCPPDRVCSTLEVKHIGTVDGKKVYDCGVNTTGHLLVKLMGEAGEKIHVYFAEEVNANGLPDPAKHHNQDFFATCDGSERVVRPFFTWMGFRYFSIEGNAEPVCVEVIHADTPVNSSFKSDNELLNYINDTFINTQLTNMHMGIPSDCPHIERRGYTGDGQLICHAAMTTLDARAFYTKWMHDIMDVQDVGTGRIPHTAPYTRSGGGPGGWGSAIVEVPYQLYKHYGDTSVIEEAFFPMLEYIRYLDEHSTCDLVTEDKHDEWCLGDWCTPIEVLLPGPFVNNYFYVKSAAHIIEMAKVIGRKDVIPALEEKIERRRRMTTVAYRNMWDENFLGGQQGANAFAYDMGIATERTKNNLINIYKRIKRYDTGIFGTDILTRVLFEIGEGQLATDLLTSDAVSSFKSFKDLGATTLWEYWPGSLTDRSHNHPMFGAVAAYLYEYLLGIRAKNGSPGYKELLVAPVIVEQINTLSGHRTLPSGIVTVNYEKADGKIAFKVSIPKGQNATFVYKDEEFSLKAGDNSFSFEL